MRSDVMLDDLTAIDFLQAVARRRKWAAGGMDSWHTSELKALPEEAWAPVAALYNTIELGADWPADLARAGRCIL
eukprot:14815958-Alexandrium_andersonii.AAC.1